MAYTFDQVKKGYGNLWDQAQVKDKFNADAMKQAKRIIDNEAIFKQVEAVTDVPWFMVGVWLYRESNLDLNTYLGNGQSLHHVTTIVPVGRGPFNTFLEGAVDAIRLEGLYKLGKAAWTLEFCLYATEKLNGFGYFSHGINSPYLWSWTNQYTRGKFTSDHGFDPDFTDPQGGCAAILKALFEIDPTLSPPRVAKEPKMPDQPTTMQLPDLHNIVSGLETVIGFLPVIAKFVPQLAPIVPFIPLIKGGLEMAADLQDKGHDPQAIVDVIIKHLGDIKTQVENLHNQVQQSQNTTGG